MHSKHSAQFANLKILVLLNVNTGDHVTKMMPLKLNWSTLEKFIASYSWIQLNSLKDCFFFVIGKKFSNQDQIEGGFNELIL